MDDKLDRLTLYLAGELEPGEQAALEKTLSEDPELRHRLEGLEATVELARSAIPVEPDGAYWESFWSRLQPKLKKPERSFKLGELLLPKHGLGIGLALGGIAAAFVATVMILHQVAVPQEEIPTVSTTTVRIPRTEGFFQRAAEQHLERTGLLLREMVNAAGNGFPTVEKLLDDRRRGEKLLGENRSLRQAAVVNKNERLAALLDELELVLMDIANLDPAVAKEALKSLQSRIEKKNLLVRMAPTGVDEPEKKTASNREVM